MKVCVGITESFWAFHRIIGQAFEGVMQLRNEALLGAGVRQAKRVDGRRRFDLLMLGELFRQADACEQRSVRGDNVDV